MASLKAEKPIGTQLFGLAKKETANKPSDGASKAPPPPSKSAPKKAAPKPKPQQTKKVKGGKSASKQ
ncbi:hypothetical protein M9H77_09659 [Catharanthus roseus]|uniref:Uncharacterized protein n=1 Tax=Catharanthus roseus TaxID=4058 RepID=A0ACC0C183_CATRO|nr:hypothetical protein M9H77_09659 [Catharanthus roseus]